MGVSYFIITENSQNATLTFV